MRALASQQRGKKYKGVWSSVFSEEPILTADLGDRIIYCFKGVSKRGLIKYVCWAQDVMDDDNIM